MHHVVAFSESQDPGGVFVNVAAVTDQTVNAIGDNIVVPQMRHIIGATACVGTAGGQVRLVSPSLRRYNPYNINPTHEGLVPSNPSPVWLHPSNPLPLEYNESLNAQENSDPAAAEQHSVVVVLADGVVSPVSGSIVTVRATTTITLVAGAWAYATIALVDELPVGTYTVVGGRAVVAAGVAFRFVPVQTAHRPGGLCVADEDNLEDVQQRWGGLGTWFDMDTTQLPGIEILSSAAAASATYQLYLDVLTAGT